MREQGCTRVLIIPLYPQYSATTTASAMDAVFDALKEMRWQPALRTTPPFHDDPNYISVTTLLKPIREIVLSRRHREETKAIDISGFIQSQMGDALHASTERAW